MGCFSFVCLVLFVFWSFVLGLFAFQGAENGCDDLTRRASCKVALAMIEYPNMTGSDCHGTTEFNFFCGKISNFKTFARTIYSPFVCQATALSTTIWKLLFFLFVFIHHNMTAYKPKMFASARALAIRKCEIISTSMPFSTASFGKKEHLSHPSLSEKPRFLQAW